MKIQIFLIGIVLLGVVLAGCTQPQENGSVSITLDKQAYGAGENVSITVHNGTNRTIFLEDGCQHVFTVLKKNGTAFEPVASSDPTLLGCGHRTVQQLSIAAGEGQIIQWEDPQFFDTEGVALEKDGTYKISVAYSFAENGSSSIPPFTQVESSEFTINPTAETEVSLQSDKTSYTAGENIVFSLSNPSDAPVYFETGCSISVNDLHFYKKSDGENFIPVEIHATGFVNACQTTLEGITLDAGETKELVWENPQVFDEEGNALDLAGTYYAVGQYQLVYTETANGPGAVAGQMQDGIMAEAARPVRSNEFEILSSNGNGPSGIIAAPEPRCEITAEIKTVVLQPAWEADCLSTGGCATDMVTNTPESYILTVQIQNVQYLDGESPSGLTCEDLFPLESEESFAIATTAVTEDDAFEAGQTIRFIPNSSPGGGPHSERGINEYELVLTEG